MLDRKNLIPVTKQTYCIGNSFLMTTVNGQSSIV
jgi:hypothetical protein